jgi:hypothetical protein
MCRVSKVSTRNAQNTEEEKFVDGSSHFPIKIPYNRKFDLFFKHSSHVPSSELLRMQVNKEKFIRLELFSPLVLHLIQYASDGKHSRGKIHYLLIFVSNKNSILSKNNSNKYNVGV